ncbi:hypothetical protein M758_2G012400 [Ceratodon purpureus]|nr:hypothetical protein M758_2G012400 [Ceratodon purpureus]
MVASVLRRTRAVRYVAPALAPPPIAAVWIRFSSSQATSAARELDADECRGFANARGAGVDVDVSFPTYMVWGSNTGVGKTLISAGLCSAILCQPGVGRRSKDLLYLKPVQTGFPADSDARYVYEEVSRAGRLRPEAVSESLFICNHTLQVSPAVQSSVNMSGVVTRPNFARSGDGPSSGVHSRGMKDFCSYESQLLQGAETSNRSEVLESTNGVHGQGQRPMQSRFTCKTLWAWHDPISPHLAVAREGSAVPDSLVVESVQGLLVALSNSKTGERNGEREDARGDWAEKWAILETAGGVASPGPSGTLQCDLYRSLRFPGVLVGDGKLGGISTTIAAYESLLSRGYDIPAIVIVDAGLSNEEPLLQYLRHKIPVLVLPSLPEDPKKSLEEWFGLAEGKFLELRGVLENAHLKRLRRLEEMPKKASDILWWPFTQHDLVAQDSVTLIDSRSGENFSVYKADSTSATKVIAQQFDACASWWTQGPDTTLQSELAREAAHTAGRYGHVMFPENVHEPALRCAELLLGGVGRGWAERVFFSDNGATSIEVAIKMAFRKYIVDHGLGDSPTDGGSQEQLKVVALKGSYHGDTLGAMEAQAPSVYTGFKQQPWHRGRGFFLEPPTVFQRQGRWLLQLPDVYQDDESSASVSSWKSRDEVFDTCRDSTSLANLYSRSIDQQLASAAKEEYTSLAALIIEPVLHGAGGMDMIDPLFQRTLVRECRRRGIPIIFDEVLSGCWRFGAESATELLGCSPDIACYSKLLTGGLVPLAATLATQPVFEAFCGISKLDALLHGHSYTAHAVGCASAVLALQYFSDPSRNPNLLRDGRRLRELWSPELVSTISSHPSVERVVSIGTIFALELRASGAEAGYASMLSKGLVEGLRHEGIYTRPLGNVVYLMCGPLTEPKTCTTMLQKLLDLLG